VTYANTISGPGAMTLNASGLTLTLSGTNTYTGGTTNTAGTLQIANNGAVGTGLVSYLSGAVKLGPGVVVSNDFCIPNSATSDLDMDTYGNGTSTWAGDVVSLGSGASWRPGGTGGTLVFTGNAIQGAHNFIVPRGTVHFGGNAVISASGTATSFCRNTTQNSANVTVEDNASITVAQFSLGGATASGGTMTLTIRDNATFSTGANNFDLHNSTAAAAISVLNLNGGTLTVGGFIKTRTGSTQFATNNFNGGTLKAGANNTSFLPNLSGLTTLVKSGGAKIDDNGFAIMIAAPLLHDPALGAASDGGLTKLGAGTLTLGSFAGNVLETYTGPTTVNAGTLVLALLSSRMTNTANIYVAPGASLDGSPTFNIAIGQTLWGGGLIRGNFIIGSGAVLSPGSNSIGTLTFSNSLTLAAGSTSIFEINKSPFTNDQVKIIGALTNGGTLIVTNGGLMALAAGDTFRLFDAANYHGSFANVVLPSLDSGLAWNKAFLNSTGTISVAAVTPPLIETTTLNNGNLVLSGSGGVPAATFYVLASTNVALPLDQWPRLLTNQFDSNGHFAVTNAMNPALSGLFYLLQVP
jgi:autotransporter-associated beta strand protein